MLLKSLLKTAGTIHSTSEIKAWIKQRNNEVKVCVERVPFSSLENWVLDDTGSLRHQSGRFFSIEGIHVETDYETRPEWNQPIINQPEVGYLGILTKEFDGVLYFLMQAKIEPGNVNCVQLSPTLQATKSNYQRVHHGKSPHYLDYFVNASPKEIILDQLQSEQGARFLRKRNRNMIIKVDGAVPELEDFRWMTLGQIKELMLCDNMVNMDTRTVLSGLNVSEYINSLDDLSLMSDMGYGFVDSARINHSFYSINQHLSWLAGLKAKFDLRISPYPISKMQEWVIHTDEIVRPDGKYFKVIGVRVTIDNREISSWCQPLIQPMQQGVCAFIVKRINGIYHFLVQAKMECGNFDVLELAPTLQCLTGSVPREPELRPLFYDLVMNASKTKVLYDVLQSEEGGRFFREQNRNMMIEVGADFPNELPERYTWMTLGQIYEFLRFNNYLNIQSRSLIAALNYLH
jgi:oxidase EvaA